MSESMIELAAGQVTVADLYREIVGMRSDVAKALTRIELIDARNTGADKLHTDHESRIRSLERFRYAVGGIALAAGGASGYIGYLVGHH